MVVPQPGWSDLVNPYSAISEPEIHTCTYTGTTVKPIHYSVFIAPGGVSPRSAVEQERATSERVAFEAERDTIDLSVHPTLISEGSSGAYRVYNSQGVTLGVFKPKDEEPYGAYSPKLAKWIHRHFFPCLYGRACLVPNSGYLSEVAASVLDGRLGLNIVPYTDSISLESPSFYYGPFQTTFPKVGSFQLFLHDYQGAREFFHEHPIGDTVWTNQRRDSLQRQVEKLVILDYLIRNTDRGLDNWLLKLDGEEVRVGAIDNGLSFPWIHPSNWRSFPYGWERLEVAEKPFSRELRQTILSLLTSPEWWSGTVSALREVFRRDLNYNEKLFRRQIEVLKGQAWNIVEVLKRGNQGPLDLVQRKRVVVVERRAQIPLFEAELRPSCHSDSKLMSRQTVEVEVEALRPVEGNAVFSCC